MFVVIRVNKDFFWKTGVKRIYFNNIVFGIVSLTYFWENNVVKCGIMLVFFVSIELSREDF